MRRILTAGEEFGKLTVIERTKNSKDGHVSYICQCLCGNETISTASKLLNGDKTSCGVCSKDGIVLYKLSYPICIGVFSISKKSFILDIEDYERIRDLNLSISSKDCGEYVYINNIGKSPIALHRFLMNAKNGEIVDHADRNTLNNQRGNLRICSKQQNSFNKNVNKKSESGVIGVVLNGRKNRWVAQLMIDGKHIRKTFEDINDAILHRLKMEKEFFGEFAPQKHLYDKYGVQ